MYNTAAVTIACLLFGTVYRICPGGVMMLNFDPLKSFLKWYEKAECLYGFQSYFFFAPEVIFHTLLHFVGKPSQIRICFFDILRPFRKKTLKTPNVRDKKIQ